MRGARGALEPLFQAEALDFRMAWVFIDMMSTDTHSSAMASASRVKDPRLAAFHDPNHVLGRTMARTLHWKSHVAWDYVFYLPPANPLDRHRYAGSGCLVSSAQRS